MSAPSVVDVHQHLWPAALVEALRARADPPRLDGWTLHLAAEAPFDVDPADHDPDKRTARDAGDGIDRSVLSLSSPLGIEMLPPDEAAPLLTAWHRGGLALEAQYEAQYAVWAAPSLPEPDTAELGRLLDRGCVGLQVPANAMATPHGLERLAGLLEVCQDRGKPVLVHPGPARAVAGRVPQWWVPVVDYVGQLHGAWWAWHQAGRALLPTLRICFAAAGGLAPVHHERLVARGGRFGRVDPDVFVDTSSYGPRGVDAVVRVLGIDAVVLGSDRPYAAPTDPALGEAATYAIRCVNPHRLLEGDTP
ncbi:MAG TPA: amidohydrolase [Nocardioidaceae bacterium]|nr:amidohydrolase [Nocardioidaceae bacterium]